jgi:type IV fimbrial biogenesis protein FimT
MSGKASKRALSASRKLASVVSSSMNSSTSFCGNAFDMSLPTDASRGARPRDISAAFHREAGFNLVELLVVVALAAILMAIGTASYRYITNSNRVSSEINGLLGDIQVARSEAVKRGQTISVCPSNTGTSCTNSSWQSGWIVFTDFNGNGEVDSGSPYYDTVLRVQPQFSGTDTIATNNANVTYLSFTRNGIAVGIPNDGNDFVYTLQTSPANQTWVRCLDITAVGGMQTERYGDASGNCSPAQ